MSHIFKFPVMTACLVVLSLNGFLSCSAGRNSDNAATQEEQIVSARLLQTAGIIEDDIQQVKRVLKLAVRELDKMLRNDLDSTSVVLDYSLYTVDSNGILTIPGDTSDSNIYLRKGVAVDRKVIKFINLSEMLYERWRWLMDNELGYKTWLSIIERSSGAMRVFPWTELAGIFDADFDPRDLEQYISGRDKPEGRYMCIEPSEDMHGLGIVLPCSKRVFMGEEVHSVITAYLPISKLYQAMMDEPVFPGKSHELLILESGKVILKNSIYCEADDVWDEFLEYGSLKDFKIMNGELILNEIRTLRNGSIRLNNKMVYYRSIGDYPLYLLSVVNK